MAPFLTHLAIGERVWHAPVEEWPAPEEYGAFLLGCLAPDVDKFCAGLEQATTHFLAKDSQGTYARRRSRWFLEHQDEVLCMPFHALGPGERAFVMGYLCHVATDENTAQLGMAMREQAASGGERLPSSDALLTALDPRFWVMAAEPERIVAALDAARIPEGTLTFALPECLDAMRRSVLPQVREGGGLEPYLRTVRRQQRWMRYGQVSDAQDDAGLEKELAAYRRTIRADLPASERLLETIDLEAFADESVHHSCQRLAALVDGGNQP